MHSTPLHPDYTPDYTPSSRGVSQGFPTLSLSRVERVEINHTDYPLERHAGRGGAWGAGTTRRKVIGRPLHPVRIRPFTLSNQCGKWGVVVSFVYYTPALRAPKSTTH